MKKNILKGPSGGKKARIEIIPLIDIMFFLLASFMLVSLSMIKLQGMQMTLPSINTPPPPPTQERPEIITLQIMPDGQYVMDKQPMSAEAVLSSLSKRLEADKKEKKDTRVFINADKAATHGMVIDALDKVKATGIAKVTFSLKPKTLSPDGGATAAPGAPAAPASPAAPPPSNP